MLENQDSILQILGYTFFAFLMLLISGLIGLASQRLMLRRIKKREPQSYTARMKKLNATLSRAARTIDDVLAEMTAATNARQNAVRELEARLRELGSQEADLVSRIDLLKEVPLPAVEHFLQMTEKAERRSAWRDYMLFASGVIVSTVIAVILKLVFGI